MPASQSSPWILCYCYCYCFCSYNNYCWLLSCSVALMLHWWITPASPFSITPLSPVISAAFNYCLPATLPYTYAISYVKPIIAAVFENKCGNLVLNTGEIYRLTTIYIKYWTHCITSILLKRCVMIISQIILFYDVWSMACRPMCRPASQWE